MQNLSIADQITLFKTLATSKIAHLALVKLIPNSIILKLVKIEKQFLWKNGNSKIKQNNFCKDYETLVSKTLTLRLK